MANRTIVQAVISGVAAALAGGATAVSSPAARIGMTVAADLLRSVGEAVTARGPDEVRRLVMELARNPPKRVDLSEAEAAMDAALAERDDAPDGGT